MDFKALRLRVNELNWELVEKKITMAEYEAGIKAAYKAYHNRE